MVYGSGKREDGDGTVFDFFIGKMDQEIAVFWSKTEVLGQFYVFFQTTMTTFIEQLIEKDSISPDD